MLITDLDLTQKRALAKDIRRCIEPDMAKTTRILKENELRRFIAKEKSLSFLGISDIISVLKTNYSKVTINRLMSKVQTSIVWDTCLCKLPVQEIEDLLYNSDKNIIITTAVLDEILKLANKTSNARDYLIAQRLLYKILDDTSSEFCSIVDVPRTSYVDDQLLSFCKANNYELHTCDYVMGLRARVRKIDVTIYNDTDFPCNASYEPNPTGKNILLSTDLLTKISFKEIISTLKSYQANKLVITHGLIETLENQTIRCHCRELIRFLVNDTTGKYSIYVSPEEQCDLSHLHELAKKYNCFILSADISKCALYKMNYIPYKLIFSDALKNLISNPEIIEDTSTTCKSNNISITEASTIVSTAMNVGTTNNTSTNVNTNAKDFLTTGTKSSNNINHADTATRICSTINAKKSENFSKKIEAVVNPYTVNSISPELIPYYSPKSHKIPLKKLPCNEQIWVIDSTGKELTPNFKTGYDAYPGYTVIHIVNTLNNIFKLNVYKIVNPKKTNYSSVICSAYFNKENVNDISEKWRSYAKRATMLT